VSTRSVHYGRLVGAGVDYITVTASSRLHQRSLHQIGQELLVQAIGDGGNERPFTAWGYDGTKCGPVSLGDRPGSTILRVSGVSAARAGADIIRAADNVSRIDLQSTVRFARDVQGLGRAHDRELQRINRQRVRPLVANVIVTHGRGDTCNVGSRFSYYKGRIYDKFRESDDEAFRRCWRYEVECKGDGAKKAARYIIEHDNDPEAIAASVDNWFRARGITPRYRSTLDGSLGPIGRTDTDATRQLRWLSRQVAPVAKRLEKVYGRDAVLAVLFDALDPGTVLPIEIESEVELRDYDEWTIARSS
jgi:hypothetical protein